MQVKSEIGKLKKVLLHCPGKELEHLVPAELERLLFDDIPHLARARQEHESFAETLRAQGAEVVYLEDLMAETLQSDKALREYFVRQFIDEAGSKADAFKEELFSFLMGIEDERELVLATMSGIPASEVATQGRQPLAELVQKSNRFLLDPIPNLYFTRDPFAVIGSGASIHRMYSETRRRETIYGQYILGHHPELSKDRKIYYRRDWSYRIEGGDILVLSEKVIAVGISQRTRPEAIELLAKNLFADEDCAVETVLALDIPNLRAYMHLDTVCTQVDTDAFVVHPGILGDLRIFSIRPCKEKEELEVKELETSLSSALAGALGLDRVRLIRCGGNDRVASEREQWNDGSNTLCVAPGVVIAYDRNTVTNALLRENGITVLEIPSSELSRGRGGPRCMSMPLERE